MSKAARGKLQADQKQMAQEAEKDLPSMYRTANVHNCFKTIYRNDEQLHHQYGLKFVELPCEQVILLVSLQAW